MSFQWDILLLETGFLAIFFAPMWHSNIYHVSPSTSVARELLRWLGFRLMVGSGLVKLLSRCPTWWTPSALHFHFETQPIPHVGSWYAHQLPDIVKRYGVAITLFSEILLPFLFYSPFREHRILASLGNIVLMILIALTGNYNFFNILTSIIMLIVLDDRFIIKWTPLKAFAIFNISVPVECIVDMANR